MYLRIYSTLVNNSGMPFLFGIKYDNLALVKKSSYNYLYHECHELCSRTVAVANMAVPQKGSERMEIL